MPDLLPLQNFFANKGYKNTAEDNTQGKGLTRHSEPCRTFMMEPFYENSYGNKTTS